MSGSGDVAVVMPARDESYRSGATVRAAAALPGVDLFLVVDDGSRDETRILAERAGAAVISHPKPRGKGAAMETGAEAVRLLDDQAGRAARGAPRLLLSPAAVVGAPGGRAAPRAEPVRRGEADMTVAVFSSTVKL